VDFSKFKPSDWMKLGGSAGMLLFGLFAWASGGGETGGNAFDFFFTGTIPWLLIVAVGVISVLLATGTIKRGGLPWDLILLAASALGALLVVIRLLIGPKVEYCGFGSCVDIELDRGFGLFLSAISSVVCAVGCFLGFKESGGNLNDLKDVNKIKGQFGGGSGGGTPPPPPGGGYSPPPPPPPGSNPPPPPPPV
jgi:hypothetical protein